MKLAIKIHESHINMIRQGLGAYIVLDSMPDQRFRGMVRKVSLLPDSSSRWGNPNLKVYATEILLVDKLPPDVKPGVSARAEIVVTNMEHVLTVPLQAITTRQGKQVAYVQSGGELKPVPVDVGLYNTRLIQIVSGLNEGDRVSLAPPLDTQEKDLGGAILAGDEAGAITNLPAAPAFTDTRNGRGPSLAEARGADAGFGPPGGGEGRRSSREGGSGQASFGPPGEGRAPGEGRPPGEGSERRGSGGGRFNREEMMKQFDKDGDGELNEEERNAMRTAMRERMGTGQGGGERRRGEGGEGGLGGGRERFGGTNGPAGPRPNREGGREGAEPGPTSLK
jgi:hypothetical protein